MISFHEAVNISGSTIVATAIFVAFVYPPMITRRATRQSCIALARAVESREPHLLGHSERTAGYVVAMARRSVRFFPWQIWDIEIAALLHTIGKVGVPHGVLNSPEAPRGDDLFAMREYVRIGSEILAAVPPLSRGASTVQYHREYLDGTGYPYGRFGQSIPFSSRLLCVASEFAAMTSPRIYHANMSAMTDEEALLYLEERAGERYDREAVELLAEVCRPTRPQFGIMVKRVAGRIQPVSE